MAGPYPISKFALGERKRELERELKWHGFSCEVIQEPDMTVLRCVPNMRLREKGISRMDIGLSEVEDLVSIELDTPPSIRVRPSEIKEIAKKALHPETYGNLHILPLNRTVIEFWGPDAQKSAKDLIRKLLERL